MHARTSTIPTYHIKDFSPFYKKEDQFVIIPFEKLRRPAPMLWPHKHSFYEITWIRDAESSYLIDQRQLRLGSDLISFISPGQVHHIERHETVKGDCLMFTEEFFMVGQSDKTALRKLAFLDNSYDNPLMKLDAASKKQLSPLIELLYEEFERPEYSKIVLCSLLLVFLTRLERVFQHPKHFDALPSHAELFIQFKKLAEAHFKEQQPISFYAGKLFVTEHQLNEMVKKASGKTAGTIVRDRLMQEAKRLLIHSQLTIGEIADQLGFSDFSYFSRLFKKQNEISPEKYRNKVHLH